MSFAPVSFWKRFRVTRQSVALAWMVCGALVVGSGLSGCQKKEMDDLDTEIAVLPKDEKMIGRIPDETTGKPLPAETAGIPKRFELGKLVSGADQDSLGRPISANGLGIQDPEKRAKGDVPIDIADVYWKLNWMRTELLRGVVPSNMDEAIAKTRQQLNGIKRDENYMLADAALTHLEKGMEHWHVIETLQLSGVSHHAIPWGSGREAVQRFIDQGSLGFGGKSPTVHVDDRDDQDDDMPSSLTRSHSSLADTSLTVNQRKAVETILDYVERYHTAPEPLMRREWKLAIQKTNELRDALGLANRKENSDGDQSDINTPITSGPADTGTGMSGLVPIPRITGASANADDADAARLGPADPFSAATGKH